MVAACIRTGTRTSVTAAWSRLFTYPSEIVIVIYIEFPDLLATQVSRLQIWV